MASVYKILGQISPGDTNVTDLYTVPNAGQVVISTIAAANLTSVDKSFDIYVRSNGTAAAAANAICYNVVVPKNTTSTMTLGITADSGDVISVKSYAANSITFSAFGLEIA